MAHNSTPLRPPFFAGLLGAPFMTQVHRVMGRVWLADLPTR